MACSYLANGYLVAVAITIIQNGFPCIFMPLGLKLKLHGYFSPPNLLEEEHLLRGMCIWLGENMGLSVCSTHNGRLFFPPQRKTAQSSKLPFLFSFNFLFSFVVLWSNLGSTLTRQAILPTLPYFFTSKYHVHFVGKRVNQLTLAGILPRLFLYPCLYIHEGYKMDGSWGAIISFRGVHNIVVDGCAESSL